MGGDEVIAADDPDLFDAADDGDVLVGVGRRYGVAVAIEADQGQRIGPTANDPASFEALLGQREQCGSLFFEQHGFGRGLAT